MICYLIYSRDCIFYGFSSFAKNMSKIIGKNISKNLSGKWQSATDALKADLKIAT